MREKLLFFFLGLLPPALGAYILAMHEQNKALAAEVKRKRAENEDLERQMDLWNNRPRAVETLSEKE